MKKRMFTVIGIAAALGAALMLLRPSFFTAAGDRMKYSDRARYSYLYIKPEAKKISRDPQAPGKRTGFGRLSFCLVDAKTAEVRSLKNGPMFVSDRVSVRENGNFRAHRDELIAVFSRLQPGRKGGGYAAILARVLSATPDDIRLSASPEETALLSARLRLKSMEMVDCERIVIYELDSMNAVLYFSPGKSALDLCDADETAGYMLFFKGMPLAGIEKFLASLGFVSGRAEKMK